MDTWRPRANNGTGMKRTCTDTQGAQGQNRHAGDHGRYGDAEDQAQDKVKEDLDEVQKRQIASWCYYHLPRIDVLSYVEGLD